MKVLIVDPDPTSRDALRRAFSAGGDQPRSVGSADEGRRYLVELRPEAVVLAADMPDGGYDRLFEETARDPRCVVWALVPQDSLDLGVAAMARGAEDFLWRPVLTERVSVLVDRLRRRREEAEETEKARLRLARVESAGSLPGRSARWVEAMAAVERLAGESSVLVTGEEGTEKEQAARFLHRLSPRGAGPLVRMGEEESFEDALARAAGGTVFVPGIERASSAVQAQILSALERADQDRDEQPGIVLAGDSDPAEAVRRGELDSGIVRHLDDRVLHLPPLRERGDDVARLARHFLEEATSNLSFDTEAMDALTAHDWPGNVTELREAVKRAARLADGSTIGPTVVRSVLGRPLAARGSRRRRVPVVRITVGDSLADVERRLIQKTLEFARGNKRKTAELLKLSLKTIYNKIKEYGLSTE